MLTGSGSPVAVSISSLTPPRLSCALGARGFKGRVRWLQSPVVGETGCLPHQSVFVAVELITCRTNHMWTLLPAVPPTRGTVGTNILNYLFTFVPQTRVAHTSVNTPRVVHPCRTIYQRVWRYRPLALVLSPAAFVPILCKELSLIHI